MNTYKLSTFLVSAFLILGNAGLHAQVVVVVNSSNPVDSLSLIELRRIYRAEVTVWENQEEEGSAIVLLDYKHKSSMARGFYKKVVGLSQTRTRLEWIGRLLNGELQVLRVALASEAGVLKYISQHAGAIGFVGVDQFNSSMSSVKDLKIDGRDFKSSEYPIQ